MSNVASSSPQSDDFQNENQLLREQVSQLQQQVDWFKRQLFGQKSEKHLVDPNPDQLGLLGQLPTPPSPAKKSKPLPINVAKPRKTVVMRSTIKAYALMIPWKSKTLKSFLMNCVALMPMNMKSSVRKAIIA